MLFPLLVAQSFLLLNSIPQYVHQFSRLDGGRFTLRNWLLPIVETWKVITAGRQARREQSSLFIQYWTLRSTAVISFNPHSNLTRWGLASLFKWGHWPACVLCSRLSAWCSDSDSQTTRCWLLHHQDRLITTTTFDSCHMPRAFLSPLHILIQLLLKQPHEVASITLSSFYRWQYESERDWDYRASKQAHIWSQASLAPRSMLTPSALHFLGQEFLKLL